MHAAINRRKDQSIETLRGVAIVLVVTYHVITGPALATVDGSMLVLQHLSAVFDHVRMPLFTVITGYVYALRPAGADLAGFYRRKARRLLLPLVTLSTLEYLARAYLPGVTVVEPVDGIWRIYLYGYMHYWFIMAVFWSFLVIGYLDHRRLLERHRHWQLCFVIALAFNLFVPRPALLSLGAGFYLLPFFLLGYGLNRYGALLLRPFVVGTCGVLFVICMGAEQLLRYEQFAVAGYTQRALALAVGVTANVLIFRYRRAWRPLAFVGSFAYFIYLAHAFSVGIGSRFAGMLVDSMQNPGVFFAACMVFGLGLPIAAQILCSRYRWFRLPFLGLPR